MFLISLGLALVFIVSFSGIQSIMGSVIVIDTTKATIDDTRGKIIAQNSLSQAAFSPTVQDFTTFSQNSPALTTAATNEITIAGAPSIGSTDNNFADDKAFQIFKEGTFFPQQSHSKIEFVAHNNYDTIKVAVTRVNDISARYLYIYVNGVQVSKTLIGSGTTTISASHSGSNGDVITLDIYYGGYANRGWLLNYAYLYNGGVGYEVDNVYFPKVGNSKIEAYFIGGPSTYLDLSVLRVNDIYARSLSVYVDDTLVVPEFVISSSYSGTLYLGSFAKRSVHLLTIQIRWGGYVDRGWQLTRMRVHYFATYVEIDWMPNYKPDSAVLSYIEDYYKNNGYERIDLFYDEEVPLDEEVDGTDLQNLYNQYADYKYYSNYRYMVFGKYAPNGALGFMLTWMSGSDIVFSRYAFVAMQAIKDTWWWLWEPEVDKVKVVAMHELGHTLTILKVDSNGNEYYDWSYSDSVMAKMGYDNVQPSLYYSKFWWTNNWWNLRQDFDSQGQKPYSEVQT